MNRSVIYLLLAFLCLGVSSCSTRPELLNVQIPARLVANTDAQKEFVANVKTLWRGMSLIEAKRHLGTPTGETSDFLFYKLIENRYEGGHYVTARLTFDDDGLSDAKLGFGHESRVPIFEE